QAELAITQADLVLLVTDVREGIVPLDREIASLLRASGKRVICAANKADIAAIEAAAATFHQLGFPELFAVSASHGLGVDSLMKALASHASPAEGRGPGALFKVAVVGKPNVGKSSYINRLLKEDRMIVHDSPGTTRDAVDTQLLWRGRQVVLIDTAGMRREGRVREPADYFSLARSREGIRRSDAVLLMLAAREEVSALEEKLARYILDQGKACVIGLNKWDLVNEAGPKEFRDYVWGRMCFMNFVPLAFISAKTGYGIDKSLETLWYAREQHMKSVPTPILNRVLHEAWGRSEPRMKAGKRCKLYYATQTGISPPAMTLFVNRRELLDKTYESYLVNTLRRAFGFEGTPIRLLFKNRRSER
ncbi:MAG: ribosome biogenesis GTPase Der, partial [Candidatus Aureabacteria bacterium]|nr:ribosome biogenesis GTPase Der [Candidatus Auribacterota bacterium]